MKAFFERLYDKSDNQFYREMKRNLQEETKMFIITANPEAFMYGEKDKQMKELLLDSSDTIVADGVGIIKAAKMLKYPMPAKIPGVDIAKSYLNMETNLEKQFSFLGRSRK